MQKKNAEKPVDNNGISTKTSLKFKTENAILQKNCSGKAHDFSRGMKAAFKNS